MSKKTRGLIFYTFLLLFIISAIILVVYATGYRYNLAKQKLESTSSLIVETKPKGAQVYINSQAQAGYLKKFLKNLDDELITPTRINELLPGEYKIELKKDGYNTWSKNLTLEKNQTTFVNDVILFKNEPAINYIPNINIQKLIAVDKDNIIYVTDKKIVEYDLANRQFKEIYNYTGNISDVIYKAKNNFLVIRKNDGDYLLNLQNNKDQLLPQNKEKWQKIIIENNNSILVSNNQGLYRIIVKFNYQKNIFNLSTQSLVKEKIVDFSSNGKLLYLVKGSNNTTTIKRYKNTNDSDLLANFSGSNYNFVSCLSNRYLCVRNNDSSQIVILDKDKDYQKIISLNNVNGIEFTLDREHDEDFLTNNDSEIWYYNYDDQNDVWLPELITRVSTKINKATWIGFTHIGYSTNNQNINAIEVDGRDQRNSAELVKFETISDWLIEENKIIFSGSLKGDSGLFIRTIY